jgi:hypothetical protein
MERLKLFGIFFLVIATFLGYSYYNYHNRSKAIDVVEAYTKKNHLSQISFYREAHFNLFDYLIGDRSQFGYVFVDSNTFKKANNLNYWVQYSSWKDPQHLETLKSYTLRRNDNKFQIIANNLFWLPVSKDSLNLNEIKGTTLETVDTWIKSVK